MTGKEGCENLHKYRTLYDAAFNGDWSAASQFLKKNKDAVIASIDKWGNTALHIAVQLGNTHFVEEMVAVMDEDQIVKQNDIGSTALHFVTEGGTKRMAEVILKKNRKLLEIRDVDRMTPLLSAAFFNNQKVLLYLYSQTTVEDLELNRFDSALLLRHLITADQYGKE